MDKGQHTSQLLPALHLDGLDGKFGVRHNLQRAVISPLVDDTQMMLRGVPTSQYALLRLHLSMQSTDNTAEYLWWISCRSFLSTLAQVASSGVGAPLF